jgi:hypothetical protein
VLIKNHHAETARYHDDGFFFVRIQMAMRLHVSARLQRVQQAMASGVIVAVEIVILTQTRTFLRSFGGLREQVGIDDGDAHKIFLKMINTKDRECAAYIALAMRVRRGSRRKYL